MSQITIKVHALGYTGDSYDELEVDQEVNVDKDLDADQLTEKDYQSAIREMIQIVNAVKLMFPDEEDQTKNQLFSIKFDVVFKSKDGALLTYEEEAFFNEAATYNSLVEIILEYVHVTDNGVEGTRVYMPENDAYETHPAGTFAILALVLRDKKWVKNYIDFLRTNDLDSEMMQMWHIKSIIEKYGWSEETTKLAIARNVSCCGQGGKEQFDTLLDNGLEEYLKVSENRLRFVENIFLEFEGWDKLQFRLEDGAEKYYASHIVSYVKHFDTILSKGEIEQIELFLWDKWKAYHAN